jgi:CDP-diglyceride synthetase
VLGKLSGILPILDGKTKAFFPFKKRFRTRRHSRLRLLHARHRRLNRRASSSQFHNHNLNSLHNIGNSATRRTQPAAYFNITRHAASQSELYGFAAAPLYFALGILLTLLVFPHPVSGAAIAIFALGDSAASIFGGLIGKRLPFNKGKTLEGSLAGFVFAFLAGSLFVAPWIAAVGAAVAMIVEYLPLPINDNVLIPLVTALTLTLLV